ncbi:3-hydroxyacyl-CoA dehydrogenase family protein [Sciscionella marina]|uniref:3-hydroxyacyl-CoA dehydrogenase family protein n=1 Tax=Sciscionella marina TaxID=508770 RepID=UPI0003726E7F|nr:3-hydroxyacyl-CoA dehydrogenase NAD-binding domain-containing protein [Sciscionella marina]
MNEPVPDFPRIGLLGFGTMGAGIAQVFAASGRSVLVLETGSERLESGFAAVSAFLEEGIARGKTTADEKSAVLGRIAGTTSVAELGCVDAVLEAVTEDPGTKQALLARVAAVVTEHTPILSNTSALSVTELAAALPNPERVAGLHFFNPAPLMRTVEVVRALQTEQALIDRLVALVGTLAGKNAAVVKDRPGFLVNALLMPYLNDVVQAYDEELATAADIDLAIELGLGHKIGPLRMLDMIGLDVHLHATTAAYTATLDPAYAPPPLLRQLVAAGRLGDKTGHGFHNRCHSREDD